jgi:predicted MFS family arabinose efflux permease
LHQSRIESLGEVRVHHLVLLNALKQLDWAMTAVLAATGFILVGICAIAVGLLHDPLMAEFHWNNGAVSGLATVYSLAALLSGPVAGVLIDRFGSRIVMTVGAALVAFGFLSLSLCGPLFAFYAAFIVIGVGYGGAFFLASTKIVATRMGAQKNLAMGIWMFAGSMGAAVFSVAVNWSIRGFGWRLTCVVAALLIAAAIPLIFMFIPRDTARDHDKTLDVESTRLPPLTLWLSRVFLVMTAASAFAAFGMSAVYFHTVPILVQAGFSDQTASEILGASWILSAVGSLFGGALSNRVGTKAVLSGSLFFGAAGTAGLVLARNPHLGMIAVVGFITLWGATANAINQFLPLLLVEHYGPAHLGALVGVQGALMGLVGSFAPFITGTLYDRTSSYDAAIIAAVLTTVLAWLFVMVLRPVPPADGAAAAAGAPMTSAE